MSLVNDALKRARQLPPPPSGLAGPGPSLRPAEPPSVTKRPAGLFWPAFLALVAACVFLLGAVLMLTRDQPARARQEPAPARAREATAPEQPAAPSVPDRQPGFASSLPTVPAAPISSNPPPATVEPPQPTAAPPAEPPSTELAPPKLQAIIFHPQRPSALIGGKTLFLGDRVGEWRVQKISSTSVTLAGPGKTIALTLE